MGCCCSCFGIGEDSSSSTRETELASKQQKVNSSTLAIARHMSAPGIRIRGATVSGEGLALAGVTIEQDAAYWEWHIIKPGDTPPDEDDDDDDYDEEIHAVKFGVSTKKDKAFYRALKSAADSGTDESTPMEDGTALMRPIPQLRDGDTIGIAVQHSDLPMVQFLLNGEPLHEIAINRFRGAVYPSIYLPGGNGDGQGGVSENTKGGGGGVVEGDISATVVFDENDFRELSPHSRFGPLIAARGII